MRQVKTLVKEIPVVGTVARGIRISIKKAMFPGSKEYWETNYARGGTSGDGSDGRLAEFKAEVLNNFTAEKQVQSVIEWGCGDGRQLALARYPSYIGLDVSRTAIRRCLDRFQGDSSKSFFWYDPDYFRDRTGVFHAELALSLDVIYHLIEDPIFELYMNALCDSAQKYLIVYSSDTDETPFLEAAHYKNRCFTKWLAVHRPEWAVMKHIPNRYPFTGNTTTGSVSDFYLFEKKS